jgi:hypothetical protein
MDMKPIEVPRRFVQEALDQAIDTLSQFRCCFTDFALLPNGQALIGDGNRPP